MRRFCIVFAIALLPFAAAGFSHDEGVDGDLSGDRQAPTTLVAALGSNPLSGSTIAGDLDYLRITLPGGLQLASLVLDSVASTDDIAFIAVQQGTTFTVNPANPTADTLLGWTHFGTGAGVANAGDDLLAAMGVSFRAIGFVPPLGATDYTFWIQQSAPQTFDYTMSFVVVPEPGSFALLVFGLLLVAWVRRRSFA